LLKIFGTTLCDDLHARTVANEKSVCECSGADRDEDCFMYSVAIVTLGDEKGIEIDGCFPLTMTTLKK